MTNEDRLHEGAVRLKPCPFCGGWAGWAHDITLAWIECGNCGAQGASWSRFREEKAAQSWNTRIPSPHDQVSE